MAPAEEKLSDEVCGRTDDCARRIFKKPVRDLADIRLLASTSLAMRVRKTR